MEQSLTKFLELSRNQWLEGTSFLKAAFGYPCNRNRKLWSVKQSLEFVCLSPLTWIVMSTGDWSTACHHDPLRFWGDFLHEPDKFIWHAYSCCFEIKLGAVQVMSLLGQGGFWQMLLPHSLCAETVYRWDEPSPRALVNLAGRTVRGCNSGRIVLE